MAEHLLASAHTLEGITECITRFYCGEQKQLVSQDGKEWHIYNLDGNKVEGVKVIKKGKRYRFVGF